MCRCLQSGILVRIQYEVTCIFDDGVQLRKSKIPLQTSMPPLICLKEWACNLRTARRMLPILQQRYWGSLSANGPLHLPPFLRAPFLFHALGPTALGSSGPWTLLPVSLPEAGWARSRFCGMNLLSLFDITCEDPHQHFMYSIKASRLVRKSSGRQSCGHSQYVSLLNTY